VCGVQTGDSLKGVIMGISWLVLCLVQSGVICSLIGFLCSSIRFHRQQQAEIKELNENVDHWMDWSRQAEAENAELKRDSVNKRQETESAKRALEDLDEIRSVIDEIRSVIEKFDDGPILF